MKTSEKIQKLMAENGVSKADIAARLKVSTRTVEHWLKDEKQPQPGNISELDAWLREPIKNLNDISIDVFKNLYSKDSEFISKIITIQNDLLTDKYQSATTDYFQNIFEYGAGDKTMLIALLKKEALLVNSFSELQASINVLTDLLLAHIAEGDKGRLNALKKEVDASKKKEVRDVLEKYAAAGEIKIS